MHAGSPQDSRDLESRGQAGQQPSAMQGLHTPPEGQHPADVLQLAKVCCLAMVKVQSAAADQLLAVSCSDKLERLLLAFCTQVLV